MKFVSSLKISPEEVELVKQTVLALTGNDANIEDRINYYYRSIKDRAQHLGFQTLKEYISKGLKARLERETLVSLLTIHTTFWFRDFAHFEYLEQMILAEPALQRKHFRLLSACCSTGEEAFSYALVLEGLRRKFSSFDYTVIAFDLDAVSIHRADGAKYPVAEISKIPENLHSFLEMKDDHSFTVIQSVRERVILKVMDLNSETNLSALGHFDFFSLRNVLIYFSEQTRLKIANYLLPMLSENGLLAFGISETVNLSGLPLQKVGKSLYSKKHSIPNVTERHKALRKAEVDEELIPNQKPIVLDEQGVLQVRSFHPQLIVIGASTGGPKILKEILQKLPDDCPPICVVQHILHEHALSFARSLAETSGKTLTLLPHGSLERNKLYMPMGDYHLQVLLSGGVLSFRQDSENPWNGHRPSVDALFTSASRVPNISILAILLSGMGKDGAMGMAKLKECGHSMNVVQNEKTSVVYGMPREAVRINAHHVIAGTREIRKLLFRCIEHSHPATKFTDKVS